TSEDNVPQPASALSITFEVPLPLRYNPEPGNALGSRVSQSSFDRVKEQFDERWGDWSRNASIGGSKYGGVQYHDDQYVYFVDVTEEEAADAWDWFAERCQEWAALFAQNEVYLRIPPPAER